MVCSKAIVLLFAISIVQFAAAFSASQLHEKLQSLESEKLEKLESKLNAHLEKQSAGLTASQLHEKLRSLDAEELRQASQKLSAHILQQSAIKLHEKLRSIDSKALEKLSAHLEKQSAGLTVNQLHEELKSLDAEKFKKASVKLAEHIRKQSENEESVDLRKNGLLQSIINKILGKNKLHEKLVALDPKALEKLESKLSAHLEKQSAGLTASELHEKVKNDAELQEKLSEHIKEKLSESISKRKAEASKRSAADCTSSITDIATQAEALIQDAVKVRTAGLTIIQGVGQCASAGAAGAAGCLSGVLSSTEGNAQALVSSIQQAIQNIQADIAKLATCAPTAG